MDNIDKLIDNQLAEENLEEGSKYGYSKDPIVDMAMQSIMHNIINAGESSKGTAMLPKYIGVVQAMLGVKEAEKMVDVELNKELANDPTVYMSQDVDVTDKKEVAKISKSLHKDWLDYYKKNAK